MEISFEHRTSLSFRAIFPLLSPDEVKYNTKCLLSFLCSSALLETDVANDKKPFLSFFPRFLFIAATETTAVNGVSGKFNSGDSEARCGGKYRKRKREGERKGKRKRYKRKVHCSPFLKYSLIVWFERVG